MSDRPPAPRRPDPWAVVEHHAQQAAARAEGTMTSAQRLALYASAAPEVIGAMRAQRGEFGLTRRGNDSEWWKVAIAGQTPGTPVFLAWNAAGEVIVQRRTSTTLRMVIAYLIAWATGMVGFARLLGPRALFPAIVVGIGVAALTRQLFPVWTPLGTLPGDDRHARALEGLVARYEADVPAE